MNLDKTLQQLVERLLERALANNHRQLLVVSGTRVWAHALVEQLEPGSNKETVLWVGESSRVNSSTIKNQQYKQYLGQEYTLIIYDCFAGLDVNAFAALTGTIKGGGVLLVIAPPLLEWPNFVDPEYERLTVYPYKPEQIAGRFLKRLVGQLLDDPQVVIVEEGKPWPNGLTGTLSAVGERDVFQQQKKAIEAIIHVVKGHRRRPLVIQSDRGRGKSAALGIAAAQLIERGTKKIILTAPGLMNVQVVFRHAQESLPKASMGNSILSLGESSLSFVAVDELVHGEHTADLLIIDEAAGIPAELLTQLLKRYSRVVFATTVHGYEGTGRGFQIRFKKVLDELTPQWKEITLTEPIRWAAADPLENWLFKSLLLNASVETGLAQQGVNLNECEIQQIDRDILSADEATLKQLFGLLVLAHYQTSPADFRSLLDGPNIQVWVVRYKKHIVAAALLAEEGGFDESTAELIWQGKRRPRGHLIAQSLSAYCGFKSAPLLQGARIIRIAVHPDYQRQGLGSLLMSEIIKSACNCSLDWIGSSFAATEDALSFWQSVGLSPVRMGVSRDASSGTFSAIVLGGLSVAGNKLFTSVHERFSEQLPYQLSDSIRSISPAVASSLLTAITPKIKMSEHDWQDVRSFSLGYRIYDVCSVALLKLVTLYAGSMSQGKIISHLERDALILKVMQKYGWKPVADQLGLAGRKELQILLQGSVAKMLDKIDKH